MSRKLRSAYAQRPRVENGETALVLGMFVLFWAVLPKATGVSAPVWIVVGLCMASGWRFRSKLKGGARRKKRAAFTPASAAALPPSLRPGIKAQTTFTPGPHQNNAPDGGAVTEPQRGEGKGAKRP